MNSKLKHWLKELHIEDFVHVALDTTSIDPVELKISGFNILSYVYGASAIITVGTLANKLLKTTSVEHGALPATNTTDKKKIAAAFIQCRYYLLRRINNVPPSNYFGPPSGNEPSGIS